MEASQRNGVRSVRTRIIEEFYTCFAFWIAVSSIPALALSYVVVGLSKRLWLRLLSSRYPHLEFIKTDTIRSLLDTHRNQGIINVLLCVKGQLHTESIKQKLAEHVVERRDRKRELMFPRLRHSLVSCWGNYAWDPHVSFNMDNHFILASGVYRGRPVNDNNIQECVSECVAKYFPNDQPPWQYIVIPCVSTEEKYYILVRVHHLLLSGKNSINIGDLLMVEQSKIPERPVRQNEFSQRSPLAKTFTTPSAIPELWEAVNENVSNAWNEFISDYDPVECPLALKSPPGAFHVAGLAIISSVNALSSIAKRNSSDRDPKPLTTSFLAALINECRRRNLTMKTIILSPLVTADPRKWPKCIMTITVNSIRTVLTLPIRVRDEITALKLLRQKGQVSLMYTFTWRYAKLAQLFVRALKEAWRGAMAAYRAPAQFWTDTVRADDGNRHALQTVSLCGRKVAAWSRPVSRVGVERVARALGVSVTDVVLYAATEALRSYFEQAHAESPEIILTTARAASEDFLYTFAEGDGKEYKKSQTGGMVCLSLPVGASPRRISAVLESACARQGALAGAWAAQARCGALTRSVPSPAAKVALNLLSRRYSVSYAEINAPHDARPRTMLWGHSLDYIVYWRPPQANISMSLTVIQYADTIRLAVMTDARLSPGQAVPASRWSTAIEQLITKVDQEIARISAQARIQETPQTLVGKQSSENIQESEEVIPEPSASMLKPPKPQEVSPPPRKKNE